MEDGQIKGVIGTNQVPTDNIAPIMAQWYSGPTISAVVPYRMRAQAFALFGRTHLDEKAGAARTN